MRASCARLGRVNTFPDLCFEGPPTTAGDVTPLRGNMEKGQDVAAVVGDSTAAKSETRATSTDCDVTPVFSVRGVGLRGPRAASRRLAETEEEELAWTLIFGVQVIVPVGGAAARLRGPRSEQDASLDGQTAQSARGQTRTHTHTHTDANNLSPSAPSLYLFTLFLPAAQGSCGCEVVWPRRSPANAVQAEAEDSTRTSQTIAAPVDVHPVS